MTMRDKIDGVLIDPDENGFHLILSGEEREYNFLLDQNAALALNTAVAAELSPWIREMQAASSGPSREELRDFSDAHAEGLHDDLPRDFCPECDQARGSIAYAPTDPKHPDFHDTMSGIYDDRDK